MRSVTELVNSSASVLPLMVEYFNASFDLEANKKTVSSFHEMKDKADKYKTLLDSYFVKTKFEIGELILANNNNFGLFSDYLYEKGIDFEIDKLADKEIILRITGIA